MKRKSWTGPNLHQFQNLPVLKQQGLALHDGADAIRHLGKATEMESQQQKKKWKVNNKKSPEDDKVSANATCVNQTHTQE
jgi:hypothetical protein